MANLPVVVCPGCGGDLVAEAKGETYSLECQGADCGWYLIPTEGYLVPDPLRAGSCARGHQSAWAFKSLIGGRKAWRCSYVETVGGVFGRCREKDSEGSLQGFAAPGRECPAAYSTKDSVMWAIYASQANSGGEPVHVNEIKQARPELTEGQIVGVLGRSVKTGHLLRLEREPLPVQGSGRPVCLTWRGQSYVLTKWPQTRAIIQALRNEK